MASHLPMGAKLMQMLQAVRFPAEPWTPAFAGESGLGNGIS